MVLHVVQPQFSFLFPSFLREGKTKKRSTKGTTTHMFCSVCVYHGHYHCHTYLTCYQNHTHRHHHIYRDEHEHENCGATGNSNNIDHHQHDKH